MLSRLSAKVVVIGGGHAGCEAAAAAARTGASTLLVTHKASSLGEMSCNPSFGGIGKGHLIREVDAMDGLCARICDKSAITYQALNRATGPAVIGLRAQIDRNLYRKHMQEELAATPNLSIVEGAVEDLIVESSNPKPRIAGCVLSDGRSIDADCVVMTTGTFLSAKIFKGSWSQAAGRLGDPASNGLSRTFNRLGFALGRLKTGTPPRLVGSTIDFGKFKLMPPDADPILFSFLSKEPWLAPADQLPTYLGYTNADVARLVLKHLPDNEHIKQDVRGPRYCPSLEAKIGRFPELSQRLFLEHEGLDSDLIYPQGMSMTFGDDVQLAIMRSIPGLEKVEIAQFAYGVHYDFVDPQQLLRSLETKLVEGLFLAGQINGTTGYEEAAAQGVLAGINAGRRAQQASQLVLDRSQAYLGVLVDDLTSLGTSEPYRMFTSRAEFRLHLRPDNADIRLTPLAAAVGAVSQKRLDAFLPVERDFRECSEALKAVSMPISKWCTFLPSLTTKPIPQKLSALDLIGRHGILLDDLAAALPSELGRFRGNSDLAARLANDARYALQQERLSRKVGEMKEELLTQLPDSINYAAIHEINLECREKLSFYRPQNIAAASRVPGVTPDVLVTLLKYAKRAPSTILVAA